MPTFHDQETGKKYHIGFSDVFFTSRPRAGSRSSASLKQVRKRTSVAASTGSNAGNNASNANITKIDATVKGQLDAAVKEGHTDQKEEKREDESNVMENVPGTLPKDEWTDEEEAKLLKMKDDEKKGWTEIAEALGRPKKHVTVKYGALKKAAKAGGKGTNQKGKVTIGRSEGFNEENVDRVNSSNDGDGKLAAVLPAFMMSAIDPTDEVKLVNMTKAIQLVEGQELSVNEVSDSAKREPDINATNKVINMCRMHDYFEHQKWVAIASELFAQTGKRITPDSLRNAFFEAKLTK